MNIQRKETSKKPRECDYDSFAWVRRNASPFLETKQSSHFIVRFRTLWRGWIQNDRILHKYPPTNITIRCSQRNSSKSKKRSPGNFPTVGTHNSFLLDRNGYFCSEERSPRWEVCAIFEKWMQKNVFILQKKMAGAIFSC
ncbi:hypothetical protein CEXT_287811 [Caerostris extrusa]|uniref:Uncharacterized protein n=1 Tax=Caerostris extrusa TaxID=172846 RepID=A0AAV4MRJ4_CAEEX|nr:hypothetical protein CEXT_287811 [Caerostris extrusa]